MTMEQIILIDSTKLGEIPRKIGTKTTNSDKNSQKFLQISQKSPKMLTKFSEIFESGAVQRIAILVDLEK